MKRRLAIAALTLAMILAVPNVQASQPQSLIFAPVSTVTLGVAPITLTASASSGLTAFTFATSSTANICTLSGSRLNIVGAGQCQLTVLQAGNATFRAAAAGANVNIVLSQPSVTFIGAQSRKTHGLMGTYSVPIDITAPLAGAVSVEPRVGSTEHRIVFQFSGPVSSVGSVSAMNLQANSYGAMSSISGSEVTVTLTGVPDGERVTIAVNGVNGSLNQFVSVGFMVGDVNGSRAVNAADISSVKAHMASAVNAMNFIDDLDANGAIDASDRSEVKARSGTVLPVTLAGGATTAPAITSGAPAANGNVGIGYDHAFVALGSTPIAWTLASGTLPPGLTVLSSGTLSGTPTMGGTYVFAVQAGNGTPPNAISPTYTVVIPDPGIDPLSVDLNKNLIPRPVSKAAQQAGPAHLGFSGGGNYPGREIRGWSMNPAICPLTEPSLTHVWYHNISLADYGGQNAIDYVDMVPNQALIYGFTAPTLPDGYPAFTGGLFLTTGPIGTPATTFVSISQTPCDFDVSKISTTTPCYTTGTSENGFTFQITNGTTSACKLVPGAQYYLNIRFQDARPAPVGEPNSDACTTQGAAACGALVKITLY